MPVSNRVPPGESAPRPRPPASWRRGFQWALTGVVLLVPFAQVGGRSLLRVDVAGHRLLAFGRVFRLDEFVLILAPALAIALTFLLVTLVFGRVWCGWACPQTTWVDLYEGLARRLGARVEAGRVEARPWHSVMLHVGAAGLGLLVGGNLVWYFLSPYEYFRLLLTGTLPFPAAVATGLVGAAVYIDLAFVRQTLCKEFCPYGRFQAVLVDRGTLTLQLLPGEADRCIDCRSCVGACPTGLDIRDGYDVACIDCGRCVDACHQVMATRGKRGLIGYAFGTSGEGAKALATPRTALVALLAIAAWGTLIFAAHHRPTAGFVVRRAPIAARTLDDGRVATFFSGIVSNRGEKPLGIDLEALGAGEIHLEVKGPVDGVTLTPGERRSVQFVVVAPAGAPEQTVTLRWVNKNGTPLAERTASLAPSQEPP